MKILYFGGQKSGKSNLAEKKSLLIANKKPFYVATYNCYFYDEEMKERIKKHKKNRADSFITIEEQKDLLKVLNGKETYLVDCISMWIFNNLSEDEDFFINQLKQIEKLDANIVFVLNEVTSGVVPVDRDSRKFVDLTGIVGQKLAQICDEVYEVKFGLESRLK